MAEFSEEMRDIVWAAAHETPAVDVRTFVKPRQLPDDCESGLDGLLTSPGLLNEFFRRRAMALREAGGDPDSASAAHEAYVKSLTPGELADIVWRQLFVDHQPLSEATRTVLTTLGLFGLDVGSGDLRLLRQQFAELPARERLATILKLANLELVLYAVDCLPPEGEPRPAPSPSPAFRPVLSLDGLLADWKESARRLRLQGYGVKGKIDEFAPLELRRYLASEIARVAPAALSLDWPAGHHPRDDGVGRLVREAALPLCRELGLPFLVASGSRYDSPAPDGRAVSVDSLAALWEDAPDVRFLLFPAGEEQIFAAGRVAARSRNVLLCGPDQDSSYPMCLENSIRGRLETSGAAFHACHSGADTPEGLVGRWAHMRWTLGAVLTRRYAELSRTGWRLEEADIRKDARALLGGNARAFMGL